MKRFERMSFRRQLAMATTVTSALSLVAVAVVLLSHEYVASKAELEADLHALAEVVATNSTGAVAFSDRRAASENLAALAGDPAVLQARLFAADGQPLADYVRPGFVAALPARAEHETLGLDGSDMVIVHAVTMEGERLGMLYLRSSRARMEARLRGYVLTVGLALLGTTLLAALLAARIHAALSRPLLELTGAAHRVSNEKDYSIRVAEEESPELRTLTAAFNGMLEQIQAQDAELRATRDALEERVRERVAELRASQAQLRAVVEHSTNLFYSHTPDRSITYLSPQCRTMFDCEPEDALSHCKEWITDNPANQAGYDATKAAVRTGMRQPPYELEMRTKTGRLVWVEVNEAPVMVDGRCVQIVGALTDITDRKRAEGEKSLLEEQLRQAQKMEAVGRLAGGVAHDFNNILGVITGYGDIVLRKVDSSLAGKVEQILKAADRAAGLTRQLLAFSRRQVLDPKVLDLSVVVGETEKMLRRLIGEDVRLTVRAARDLGTVRADPGQIEQVLMNLAVNARDAMPQGGSLEITLANVDVDAGGRPRRASGRCVRMTVTDTGHGMSAEVMSHVFEPFFTTKEQGKGTGLGLATVYGIVEQSGGTIEVDSRVGEGTRFHVDLPRVDEVVTPRDAAGPAPLVRGTGTVLLVEDEEPLRELIKQVLAAAGYDVLAAAGGAQALSLAERYSGDIAVLLTDVVMPGLSGPQLATALRSRRPAVEVIYMSGYTDDALAPHGVLGPGCVLIHKPFTQAGLLARVAQSLAASQAPEDCLAAAGSSRLAWQPAANPLS